MGDAMNNKSNLDVHMLKQLLMSYIVNEGIPALEFHVKHPYIHAKPHELAGRRYSLGGDGVMEVTSLYEIKAPPPTHNPVIQKQITIVKPTKEYHYGHHNQTGN